MIEDKQTFIRNFFDNVWNTRNVGRVGNYVGPRYTIHHDPGDPWEGQTLDLEGWKNRLVTSCAPFPDQIFTITEMVSDGDRVVVFWTWKGTHKGDLPGFPAGGKVIKTSGVTIYYFAGDKLSGHWQIVDRLGIFQQLSQQQNL